VDASGASLTLPAAAVALVGVALVTDVGGRVDRVLRAVAVGALIGNAVAYRRSQRRPGTDPFPIITRWSFAGLLLGLLLEAIRGVLSAP